MKKSKQHTRIMSKLNRANVYSTFINKNCDIYEKKMIKNKIM